jgi:hypothetical protein
LAFFAAAGFALARTGTVALRLAAALATLFLMVFFAFFFVAAVFIAIPPMAAPLIRAGALSSVATSPFTQLKRDRPGIEAACRTTAPAASA